MKHQAESRARTGKCKRLWMAVIFLLVFSRAVEANQYLELDFSTVDNVLMTHGKALILFSAGWSKKSKIVRSMMKKLVGFSEGEIQVGEISCDKAHETCHNHLKIQNFPTIRLYFGTLHAEYTGELKLIQLKRWLSDRLDHSFEPAPGTPVFTKNTDNF